MALRDDVLGVLNALCEGSGVSEYADGDLGILLGDVPLCVRVFDDPETVCVFCQLATKVPLSPEVTEFLHDTSRVSGRARVRWAVKKSRVRSGQLLRVLSRSALQIGSERLVDGGSGSEMVGHIWREQHEIRSAGIGRGVLPSRPAAEIVVGAHIRTALGSAGGTRALLHRVCVRAASPDAR